MFEKRELVPLTQILKFGPPKWGSQIFYSSEWSSRFWVPLDYGSSHQGWNLWWDYVPASTTYFDVVFFSFVWCVVIDQPDFRFFRENSSLCRYRLRIYSGAFAFRIFLYNHFEPEFHFFYYKFKGKHFIFKTIFIFYNYSMKLPYWHISVH